jgi:hypothetical protein
LHHPLLAGPAGVAGSADHPHPQLRRDDVEHLLAILADHVQRPATAGAALGLEVDQHLDPRQVRRQGAQVASAARGGRGVPLLAVHLLPRRLGGRRGLLEVLQAELELVGVEPLRAPAEPPRCSCRISSRSFSISACAASCPDRAVSRSIRSAVIVAFCWSTTSVSSCRRSRSGSEPR